jgi:putative transcriptional regulator
MATVRYTFDPAHPRGLSAEERTRLDAMTPEQIEENARTDPDNPPLTDEEMERGLFGRDVRRLRQSLALSQKEFAERYAINLARLRDWEQGRFNPDSVTRAYIKLIAHDPEGARKVLEGSAARTPQAALSNP